MIKDFLGFVLACVMSVAMGLAWLWFCSIFPYPWGVVVMLGVPLVLLWGYKPRESKHSSYHPDEDAGGL